MSDDARSTRDILTSIETRLLAIENHIRPIVELVDRFGPKLEKFRKFL